MRTNWVKMAAICLLLSGVAAKGQTNVSTDGGTTYRIPKFSGTGTITNSVITEQNGRVGIGTSTPAAAFDLPRFTGGGPLMTLGASRFLNYVPLDIHIDGNPGPTGANGMWISSGTDFNSASSFSLYVYPNNAASTNATMFNDTSGNAGLTVFDGGGRSKGFVFTPSTVNGYMDFRVGPGGSTTSALRITGDGSIGIGTTSPGAKLEVNGSLKLSGSNGGITFPDNSVQTKALPENALLITSNSTDSFIAFENKGPGGRVYSWDVGSVGAGIGAGNFAIYDVTGGTARFVVTPVGYIGINTINPQYQLDVNGNIKIEGNSALYFPDGSHLSSATGLTGGGTGTAANLPDITDVSGKVGIGTTTPSNPLQVVGTGDVAAFGESSSTSGKQLLLGVNTSGNGYGSVQSVYQGTGYTPLALNPNGGYVGIGNTAPAGLLDIKGVGGLIVSGANLDPNPTVGGAGPAALAALKGSGRLLVGWNASGGDGEVDLVSSSSQSTRGFRFYDYTPAGAMNLLMAMPSNGNVGIGTASPGSKLEINGNVKLTAGSGAAITFQDNSVQTVAWNGVLSGGDYAESVDVTGDRREYEPGDVLVIDPAAEGKFLKASEPYSTGVMGIYSTTPGVIGRRQKTDKVMMKDEVPMAMTGIVPTKVSAENGPIKPGDLLVTSSKPGYAMKGTDRSLLIGAVVGKALGHLTSGTGLIEVAVTLQ